MKSVDTTLETVGGMLRRETETENVKKKSCRFYISPEAEINSQIINHRIKKKTKNLLLDLNIFISLIDNVLSMELTYYTLNVCVWSPFLACLSN